jgi:hypothetical protein
LATVGDYKNTPGGERGGKACLILADDHVIGKDPRKGIRDRQRQGQTARAKVLVTLAIAHLLELELWNQGVPY